MTSPASAQFPWSEAPEPPSGEFRSGRLPSGIGGDYLAARGSRPGPALLMLVSPESGYGAVHGVFQLASVLDARRLSGSLLVRLAADGDGQAAFPLTEPSDMLIVFDRRRPAWRELPLAGYRLSGDPAVDRQADAMAANSGARRRYSRTVGASEGDLLAAMASRKRPAVSLRIPDRIEDRPGAAEAVFQGLINMLRVAGMLEGQLAPAESLALQSPAHADAPVVGYWSPSARPGQHLRINDRLGSFRDAAGRELGDLLTNISGTLLGISDEVHVEAGQPVAELARTRDA